jgi:hypothetical protein
MRLIAALIAVAIAAILGTADTAAAATPTAPAVPIFTGKYLQDPNISQSLAYDPAHRVWVFAQQRYGHPAGDLTLTATTAAGSQINHMYVAGFGHGIAISLERINDVLYVWIETKAISEPALPNADAGMYGYKIARIPWRPGATLTPTSTGVLVYGGNQPEETPSLDVAHNQIGIHYYAPTSGRFRYVVYRLSDLRAGRSVLLASLNEPAEVGVSQGWVLAGGYVYRLDQIIGVRATITQIDMTGAVVATVDVAAATSVPYWEPEGITVTGSNLCINVAGGASSTRHTVNVFCQAAIG